jgi:hypothetical protein
MKSNKQKREELARRRGKKCQKEREQKRADELRRQWARVKAGKCLPMDRSKIRSRGNLLFDSPPDDSRYPYFYEDIRFVCRDCGKAEVWTAQQQKWWHEEAGGDLEATAVRCRDCRTKERARKEEANRVREEGLARKRKGREA